MSKQIGRVTVKALQAYTRDVGRNIARIDPNSMDNLGISMHGILEIVGERRTASKCMPLYKGDLEKGIMRIDGLIRENAGLEIGGAAEIRKAEPVLAERISIAPLKGKIDLEEQSIIETLTGTPLVLGDKIMIPVGLEWESAVVLDAQPRADVYFIGEKTRSELLPSIT